MMTAIRTVECPKTRQTMEIELVCHQCGQRLAVLVATNGWFFALEEVAKAHHWKVGEVLENEAMPALCPTCQ